MVKSIDRAEFITLGAKLTGNDLAEAQEAHRYFYDTHNWYNDNSVVNAIVENNELQGWIMSRLDGNQRTISRLYVRENVRNKGLSNNLVESIENVSTSVRIKCLKELISYWSARGYKIDETKESGGYYTGVKNIE